MCSISNTQPSYFEALMAIAEFDVGGRKAGQRVLPGFQRTNDVIQTRQIGHFLNSPVVLS